MENFIRVYQNAYSAEYCNQVIEFFELACAAGFGLTRAEAERAPKHVKDDMSVIFPSDTEMSIRLYQTTDHLENFLRPLLENFYEQYASNFSVLNDLKQTVYSVKIQRTKPGGGYHIWHFEDAGRKHCSRVTAFTLYLNTIAEGGETEFLYYGLRVKPEQGTLVIWPAGFTHVHRGNPPLKETKYIITGWFESD